MYFICSVNKYCVQLVNGPITIVLLLYWIKIEISRLSFPGKKFLAYVKAAVIVGTKFSLL